MNYYVGLDLGTSGVKTVVFDVNGKIISTFLEEYNIISPKDGYAEQNPIDWLNATYKVLYQIGKLNFANDIKGIGLSGQMHGLVLLDSNDGILRNSIIWCDNRTGKEALEIEDTVGFDELKKISGNIAMAPFTLAKLLWVKNNEPDIYNKISKVMLPKDYIAYMLTKSFCAEYSDTSGMQVMDIEKLEYSKELLSSFNIPVEWFGKLIRSDEIRGYLTEEVQAKTGLKNVFICGGAGDQAAGGIGNGILSAKDVAISLGSSGVVYAPTDNLYIAPKGEVQTFASAIYSKYFIMGVTNGCGTSLKWLRDEMFNQDYNSMVALAQEIDCGSNNLFYLPYLMGERTPILDGDAKGVFFGLRNTTSKGEIIRSVMEGVGYSIKDCFELLSNDKEKVLISGGGAKSLLYRQIIASMIGKPVIQIKQDEGPALGAAILAMVADGQYHSIEDACNNLIELDDVTYPIEKWQEKYNKGFKIYKKLYSSIKDLFKDIRNDNL